MTANHATDDDDPPAWRGKPANCRFTFAPSSLWADRFSSVLAVKSWPFITPVRSVKAGEVLTVPAVPYTGKGGYHDQLFSLNLQV